MEYTACHLYERISSSSFVPRMNPSCILWWKSPSNSYVTPTTSFHYILVHQPQNRLKLLAEITVTLVYANLAGPHHFQTWSRGPKSMITCLRQIEIKEHKISFPSTCHESAKQLLHRHTLKTPLTLTADFKLSFRQLKVANDVISVLEDMGSSAL